MTKNLFRLLNLSLLSLFTICSSAFAAAEPTFSDVDSSDESYAAVEYFAKENIIEGYLDGSFGSKNEVNRAEAAKIMILVNNVQPDPQKYKNCFLDVQDQWFAKYICYGKEQGWLKGYPDGNFLPGDPVSHAELTKMTLEPSFGGEILGQSSEQVSKILEKTGIESTAWYAPYLAFGEIKNVLWRTSGSNWPNLEASRQQVVEQFFRAKLMHQENWNVYSHYLKDIYFQNKGMTDLVTPTYPCYYTYYESSDLSFYPALSEYLKTEYGITKLDALLFSWDDYPYFVPGNLCVRDDGGVIFSGITAFEGEDDDAMRQHLIEFDAQKNLVKDDWSSCYATRLYSRPTTRIIGVDPNTVQLINCHYLKDKDSIYYLIDPIYEFDELESLPNVEVNSFEVLNLPFSKDSQHVYYFDRLIEGADAETFEVVNHDSSKNVFSYFAKDKSNVYLGSKVIENADPDAFERVPFEMELMYATQENTVEYSRDKNSVFFYNRVVQGADPETFEILDFFYSKDKNNVYVYGEVIEDIDADTFEILNETFSKDKNSVYRRLDETSLKEDIKALEDVDIQTFEVIDTRFSKDKNNVYYLQGDLYGLNILFLTLEGADPETFEVINEGLAKDSQNSYEVTKWGVEPLSQK